ncbi:MAG: glycosyltransferase family 4 protein [Acidobacteriia bacterium]|nr:glycosyltransferase family 4 protein [Terriglobia bacterium]
MTRNAVAPLEDARGQVTAPGNGPAPERRYRLAILASHVIQYQDPLFKALGAHPAFDVEVFFCSDSGAKPYMDSGFGREVKWDIDLLQGYKFQFLRNLSRPGASGFWGAINPQIVSKIRKGKFDALLVHGWATCTIWAAIMAALVLKVPILMRGDSNPLRPVPLWKRAMKKAVLVPLFKCIRGFLAIGTHNANFYKGFGAPENKIFLVPFAVNNAFFFAAAERLRGSREAVRQRIGVPPGLPVILFCGKLSDVKRPLDLLTAFAPLQQEASLVFVGDGPLKAPLQEHVAKKDVRNVHFAGFKNQSELPEFYAAADIFVLPSEFEPWGLTVNEAMCFGLPVIASDRVGAGGDLVKDRENGFIFPYGDVQQLASLLATLVRDTALRKQMADRSRAIIEHWSYDQDVEALAACLAAVAPRQETMSTRNPSN